MLTHLKHLLREAILCQLQITTIHVPSKGVTATNFKTHWRTVTPQSTSRNRQRRIIRIERTRLGIKSKPQISFLSNTTSMMMTKHKISKLSRIVLTKYRTQEMISTKLKSIKFSKSQTRQLLIPMYSQTLWLKFLRRMRRSTKMAMLKRSICTGSISSTRCQLYTL